ncbi:RHS repeat-associated core domain-containing protein, partial [Neptuniibacter sp.]|uniref:RHS repeat-associated core domain-containing protein n=1 Tax=Neptuniibacter sp. TaxID=1962643 RepID=UPI0026021446
MRQGGVVQYLHGDHLGSTSLTTDESGAMVARQLYHPYGTTRYSEGTLATDFGFTGQRNVAGTGLVFMHARFYDPALGRFVSADTIVPDPRNPQSLNRYSYVYNRPLVYIDPDGHIGIVAIVGLVAASIMVLTLISDVAPPPDSPKALARSKMVGNQIVFEKAFAVALTCMVGILAAPAASGAIGTAAATEAVVAEATDGDN